jgi:hypothetical protein
MVIHKVRKEDLQVGAIIEKEEHPWASERTAKRIARDHLQENPKAYSGGGGKSCGPEKESIIVLNQNIKVKTQKPKKKPLPPQQAPVWQTWGNELLRR